MAHPLGVVVDHIRGLAELVLDLQDFIHLLLIFSQHHRGVGVIDDVLDFGGDGVLIDGHWYTAESLGCHQRPVKLWSIITDDGELIAALKAKVGET
jgi:hypothetical protein